MPDSNHNGYVDRAWYYLYNMRVRSLDCPSPQRTAVTPTTGAGATANDYAKWVDEYLSGSQPNASGQYRGTGLSYQWYNNGRAHTWRH